MNGGRFLSDRLRINATTKQINARTEWEVALKVGNRLAVKGQREWSVKRSILLGQNDKRKRVEQGDSAGACAAEPTFGKEERVGRARILLAVIFPRNWR